MHMWASHFAGIRLNSVSTSEDIVSAATEMLRQRCMECTACTLRNFKKHLELFGNAAKESTVVVLGLGLHVHAFSKVSNVHSPIAAAPERGMLRCTTACFSGVAFFHLGGGTDNWEFIPRFW